MSDETPRKECVCTGVRWCASCRDPRIRRLYRMDDPVRIPSQLEEHLSTDGQFSDRRHGLHDFSLELQYAPSAPDFRGVHVLRDFLSASEAERLLREIEKTPFRPAQSGKLKQHYGAKVNFNKQKINTEGFRGLPDYARCIESRLHGLTRQKLSGRASDHLALRKSLEAFETTDAFLLRYLERNASNLDFHRDDTYAYGEAILDLSLESNSVLTFLERACPGSAGNQANCVRIPLPARSLAVIYGPARFAWDHAILARDIAGRRTSISLRTLSEALRHSEAGERILGISRAHAMQP